MEEWKVLRRNLKNKKEPTLQLYNLIKDPWETNNLADEHLEIIGKAAALKTHRTFILYNSFTIILVLLLNH